MPQLPCSHKCTKIKGMVKLLTASDLPKTVKDLLIIAELKRRERVDGQFSTDRPSAPLWDSRPTQWRFIWLHPGTAGRREPFKCTQTLSQQLSWTIGQQEMKESFWITFSLLSSLIISPMGGWGSYTVQQSMGGQLSWNPTYCGFWAHTSSPYWFSIRHPSRTVRHHLTEMNWFWLPYYFPLVNLCLRQPAARLLLLQSPPKHGRLFTSKPNFKLSIHSGVLWSQTKSWVCVLPQWDLYFPGSLVKSLEDDWWLPPGKFAPGHSFSLCSKGL